MKKLKVKVFFIIFTLLSLFTMTTLITSTTRSYMDQQRSIKNLLNRFPKNYEGENTNNSKENNPVPPKKEPDESRKIIFDFTLYTIILDEEGNYQELINHTDNSNLNEESIKKIANNIISTHKENFYIGNLYTTKYSYAFTRNNTLIIVDNTETNNKLRNQLLASIILFLFFETIIFVITNIITRWIITPVKNSFEKQKIFVADASHELKTPLSVMIASSDAYFNDKDEKWVKNMRNESERMIKLVTELLDLAKTEQEQDIVMEENNLSDIIEGSILTFESLFYENKIKLDYKIEDNIKMNCNENLIIELMSILIDNAIKHCKEKGTVEVNLSHKNKQIVLEVKNTGDPIKKEEEEKIFERFYKVDSSRNRNSNNYGLGLAIAKNIVERHHGEIKGHSQDGYTTFKVTWNQK